LWNDHCDESIDWFGMSHFDVFVVAKILMTDPSQWVKSTESSMQGLVNNAVALRTVLSEKFLQDPQLIFNGTNIIGSNQFGYWGNSQVNESSKFS
jgi:hypothetical protein